MTKTGGVLRGELLTAESELATAPDITIRTLSRAEVTLARDEIDHLTRGALIAHEQPFVDNRIRRRGNAFIIPADGGAAAFLSAVGDECHQWLSEPEFAEDLVRRREERRAGVIGFVTERPIQLGRMRNRFVNRQPEMRRVKHEIPCAGLDRWCG